MDALLMQREKPLAFFSQALKVSGINDVHLWEGVVHSSYNSDEVATLLSGSKIVVKSDHQSLKYLLNQKVGTPIQQKWITKQLGYDFIVKNRVTDTFSMRGTEEECSMSLITFPTMDWVKELKVVYKENELLQNITTQD